MSAAGVSTFTRVAPFAASSFHSCLYMSHIVDLQVRNLLDVFQRETGQPMNTVGHVYPSTMCLCLPSEPALKSWYKLEEWGVLAVGLKLNIRHLLTAPSDTTATPAVRELEWENGSSSP